MNTLDLNEDCFFDYESFRELVERRMEYRIPSNLYKSLFFEDDLGILFGPPQCDKDLFATMIGEEMVNRFEELGYEDSGVLYLDLEKSDKQQMLRYSDFTTDKAHAFSDRLIRLFYFDRKGRKLTSEDLFNGLLEIKKQTEARAIIIDNLTYLCRGRMESVAADFMQKLYTLKVDYGVSILVLVHTQRADDFKPITLRDLKGSDFLLSIADSIFAMNISRRGKDIQYVKQLKSRCAEIEYGADNVMVFKKERDADGGLCLNFKETTPEAEQIDIDYEAERELVHKIRELHYEDWSIRKIAKKFNISRMRVWRSIHED